MGADAYTVYRTQWFTVLGMKNINYILEHLLSLKLKLIENLREILEQRVGTIKTII